MDAAERILLALDAHDCWAPGRALLRERASPADAIVIDRGPSSDFGTVAGQQSVAEVQDLMRIYASAVSQLAQQYAGLSAAWHARDAAAFTDWTTDWTKFQARYNAAVSAANTAVTLAAVNVFTPNSLIAAQPQYDGIMKAIRQCYPPDGCPVVKGDWDDLVARLSTAAASLSLPPVVLNMPQPGATDIDQQLFASTSNLDVVAQATGLQATGPLPQGSSSLGFLKWIVTHKTGVMIGAVAVVGGIILIQLLPVLMLPFKAAKGVAALAA